MEDNRLAISFVGTGNYQETCYTYGGDEVCTALFPVAVRQFFPDYEPLILLTEEARQKHGEALLKAGFSEEQLVHIPSGKKEEELWEIFDRISAKIPEGSELVLDVTHGFRTQPIILLAVVEFLKSARDITVSHIVYGAYEAGSGQAPRSPSAKKQQEVAEQKDVVKIVRAPVWDLRAFLDLMDWAAATRRFLDTGDASLLQRSLKTYHGRTYKEGRDKQVQAQNLENLGNRLGELAEAFRLNRVSEVPAIVTRALNVLQNLKKTHETERIPEAHPLELLLVDIESMLRSLHYPSDARGLAYLMSREGLCMQASLVAQLLRFGLYQQAITVARECMVNYYMATFFPCKEPDFIIRESADSILGKLANKSKEKGKRDRLSEQERRLFELWNQIVEIRNDVNHAGMRAQAMPANTLRENIRKYACELVDFIRKEVACRAD